MATEGQSQSAPAQDTTSGPDNDAADESAGQQSTTNGESSPLSSQNGQGVLTTTRQEHANAKGFFTKVCQSLPKFFKVLLGIITVLSLVNAWIYAAWNSELQYLQY